jgi:hypothetical protein
MYDTTKDECDSDAEENFWDEDDGYPAGEQDTDRDTDYEPDYIPPVHHPTDNSFDSDPTPHPTPSMAAGGREEPHDMPLQKNNFRHLLVRTFPVPRLGWTSVMKCGVCSRRCGIIWGSRM